MRGVDPVSIEPVLLSGTNMAGLVYLLLFYLVCFLLVVDALLVFYISSRSDWADVAYGLAVLGLLLFHGFLIRGELWWSFMGAWAAQALEALLAGKPAKALPLAIMGVGPLSSILAIAAPALRDRFSPPIRPASRALGALLPVRVAPPPMPRTPAPYERLGMLFVPLLSAILVIGFVFVLLQVLK
jgi:hypothetical protein